MPIIYAGYSSRILADMHVAILFYKAAHGNGSRVAEGNTENKAIPYILTVMKECSSFCLHTAGGIVEVLSNAGRIRCDYALVARFVGHGRCKLGEADQCAQHDDTVWNTASPHSSFIDLTA